MVFDFLSWLWAPKLMVPYVAVHVAYALIRSCVWLNLSLIKLSKCTAVYGCVFNF